MTETKTIFRISPLIRITLFSLYISLTIPLPFLAKTTDAPVSPVLLWIGISLGAIALLALLSEQVILDPDKIQVTYPPIIRTFIRKNWSLNWSEIKELKMRTTGQGGLVYYFVTEAKDRAYLLPMRVAGFNKMVTIIQEKTSLDTSDIRPLSQPWMYFILLLFTFLLFLIDLGTINTAINPSFIINNN
jgi:hypothetical protein